MNRRRTVSRPSRPTVSAQSAPIEPFGPLAPPLASSRHLLLDAWKLLSTPRNAILCALALTYVWRFHDLSGILSPLRLAAVATVGSWCYLVLQPRARQLRRLMAYPYIKIFYIWAFWLLITAPSAISPGLVWQDWSTDFFKTITMVTFVLATLRGLKLVHFTMATQIVGAAVLTMFYIKGGFSLDVSPVPMYDVNDMALLLNMTLPMTLYFAMTVTQARLRKGLWLLAVLMATCVLMTQSRGGFLTLGMLLLVMALRLKVSWWARLLPPLALILGFFMLPAPVQDRLSTLFNPSEDYNMTADEGRIEIWKRGLGYLRENPITGVGMKNFPLAEVRSSIGTGVTRRMVVTHNSFLEVATESGLVGIALFLGMLATGLTRLRKLRGKLTHFPNEQAPRDLVMLADCLTLSIAAYCIGGFFLSLGYLPMLFLLMAIVAAFEGSATAWLAGARQRTVRTAPPGAKGMRRVYRTT